MTERTPAAEAPTDHVLRKPKLDSKHSPVHLPTDDDPFTPRCNTVLEKASEWVVMDVDDTDERMWVCAHCDPNHRVAHVNSSYGLVDRLMKADPDDVSRAAMEASD